MYGSPVYGCGVYGGNSFLDGLDEGAKESDMVFLCEFIKKFVVLKFDAGEEFDQSNPGSVELGICARCSGAFSGTAGR